MDMSKPKLSSNITTVADVYPATKDTQMRGQFRFPLEILDGKDRIIVLVDAIRISDAEFARIIWFLASPARLNVLFLALAPSDSECMAAERRLTSLAAITRDAWVHVETVVFDGRSWMAAIQSVLKPTDVIACHAEQTVWGGLFKERKPLAGAIRSITDVPIYEFCGLYLQSESSLKRHILMVSYWLLFLAIIIAFFFLEAQVISLRPIWAEEVILCLVFIIELGVLWVWNSIQL